MFSHTTRCKFTDISLFSVESVGSPFSILFSTMRIYLFCHLGSVCNILYVIDFVFCPPSRFLVVTQ